MGRVVLIMVMALFAPYAFAATNAKTPIIVEIASLLPVPSITTGISSEGFVIRTIQVPGYVKARSACETVWIGIDVPVKSARKVITRVIKAGVALHYIGIQGDYDYRRPPAIINRTIMIGGSTRSAINQGIKRLSSGELIKILYAKNDTDFHKEIRSTYGLMSKRYWIHRIRD